MSDEEEDRTVPWSSRRARPVGVWRIGGRGFGKEGFGLWDGCGGGGRRGIMGIGRVFFFFLCFCLVFFLVRGKFVCVDGSCDFVWGFWKVCLFFSF